jgi:hypothetical protein
LLRKQEWISEKQAGANHMKVAVEEIQAEEGII